VHEPEACSEVTESFEGGAIGAPLWLERWWEEPSGSYWATVTRLTPENIQQEKLVTVASSVRVMPWAKRSLPGSELD
jgi:hypothetical protein